LITRVDWPSAFKPLLKKYKGKRHPLEYKNTYQLLVMVILSAQDSDKHINSLAPAFFKEFPSMKVLSKSNAESIQPFISKVRNFRNKSKWIIEIAKSVKQDKNIPLNLEDLTALPGIGRKSANVILREAGKKAEGVIVDLHVVRVAPRIGIVKGADPKKIELQLMEAMPQKTWNDLGMALSFLGRETCRPANPKHVECVMNTHCEYCRVNTVVSASARSLKTASSSEIKDRKSKPGNGNLKPNERPGKSHKTSKVRKSTLTKGNKKK
jgi:endonuclease-3